MKRRPARRRPAAETGPTEVAPNEAHAYLAGLLNSGMSMRNAVELACHRAVLKFFHPDPLTKSLRNLGRTMGASVKAALDQAAVDVEAAAAVTAPPDSGTLR